MKCNECKARASLVRLEQLLSSVVWSSYESGFIGLARDEAVRAVAALSALPADEGQEDGWRRGVADAALKVAAIASFIAHDLPECAAIAEQVPTGVVIRELHKMIGISPADPSPKDPTTPPHDDGEWAKDRETIKRLRELLCACEQWARRALNGDVDKEDALGAVIEYGSENEPSPACLCRCQWGAEKDAEIAHLRALLTKQEPSEEEVERVARLAYEAYHSHFSSEGTIMAWEGCTPYKQEGWRVMARAVLKVR
jgi:hypothetical protein